MRLASYLHDGRPMVGVVTAEGVRDLSKYSGEGDLSPMRRLLMQFGGTLDSLKVAELPTIPLDQLIPAPLISDPSKIIAAPVNYSDHQEEMRQVANVQALGIFLKAPSSVLSNRGTVVLPYVDRRFDQEGELAVIIGRTLKNVPEDEAISGIAGFTTLLDITMRGGEDRSTRKSFDTFTPVGPYLVTPDEIGDIGDLRIECSVNGIARQDAHASELIWGVGKLVSYVSSVMTLMPGDIITTGTPAGVGEILDGDEITLHIGRVGTLSVSVSAVGAVTAPTAGSGLGPVPPIKVTPVRERTSAGTYLPLK